MKSPALRDRRVERSRIVRAEVAEVMAIDVMALEDDALGLDISKVVAEVIDGVAIAKDLAQVGLGVSDDLEAR
jgi:hypothetical protein